ncbi:MAG: hypothetical protein BGP04_20380 [Rhizobiales bacterium 62-17]|nr:hypothetical protein [Hyphomicrobiales bacterium]OJX99991.1 MAG: hypothetical protein BGP04_20380 [Rhizobiales bacterium 62-17]
MRKPKRPQLPVVGLIGPTNLRRISEASGIPERTYRDLAYEAGRTIAECGAMLAVVPDRGIAVTGMRGYRDAHGPWTIGLVPDGGPSDTVATPNCVENAAACDEILDGFTWHHQHAAICELSNLLLCVGLSCGTMAEIAWTKWVHGPRVLVLRETISLIPKEILAETDVVFIDDLKALKGAVQAALTGPKSLQNKPVGA